MWSYLIVFAVALQLISWGLSEIDSKFLQYVGCFKDDPAKRILPSSKMTFPPTLFFNNHPDTCAEFCRKGNYAYAGLENTYDCYCGNEEPTTKSSDSNCNVLCLFANALPCGSPTTASVYRSGVSPSGEKLLLIQTRPNLAYVGCFKNFFQSLNATNSSTLFPPGKYPTDEQNARLTNTPAHCTRTCNNNGFALAGVTKGTGCFCSNDVDQAEKTDEENCMAPCEGNPFIRCGGFESVAVYNKTGPQI